MNTSRFVRSADTSAVPADDARWFAFMNDRLVLVPGNDRFRLPDTATLLSLGLQPERGALLGYLDSLQCFAGELLAAELPQTLQLVDLRQAYGILSEHEYGIAGYAAQIAHWNRTTRFCPVCATPTEALRGEWAKRCPACGFLQYPRVTPAIIVLVYRPGQILLTRQATWPPNRYSLIAGFVEAGESLEACLRREVAEEVGVSVDTIRYLGSQPWPFPHQLMVGFCARYYSGELQIDPRELEDAAWFDLDALPDLPPPMSISRQILDWHLLAQQDPGVPFPGSGELPGV